MEQIMLELFERKWQIQAQINDSIQQQIKNTNTICSKLQDIIEIHEDRFKDIRLTIEEINTTDIPEDVQELLRTME